MKNITKLSFVASFVFALAMTISQPAQALSANDAAQKLLDNVLKITSSQAFKDKFCRKADAFSGVFSVRSASGVACSVKEVAAMAELICTEGNLDDYMNSGCHKEALKVLKGADPRTVLETSITQNIGKARGFMCKNSKNLPPQLVTISKKACPAA